VYTVLVCTLNSRSEGAGSVAGVGLVARAPRPFGKTLKTWTTPRRAFVWVICEKFAYKYYIDDFDACMVLGSKAL
jgi:hypothetical protein